MPEIDREKLSAKLDMIPEADRENYVKALRENGYTWRVSGAPAKPAQPPSVGAESANGAAFPDDYHGFWGGVKAMVDMAKGESRLPTTEKAVDPMFDNPYFKSIAAVGKFANQGNQDLAGLMAEHGGVPGAIAGTALGTASEFLLPTTEEGAGMLALPGLSGTPGTRFPTSKSRDFILVADESKKAVKQSVFDKAAGGAISATTAVPQRYASAVVADPTILNAETPTMAQVGQEYEAAFKKAGMKVDSELMRRLTNKRYFPSENQIGEINDLIDGQLTKIENLKPGGVLDPSELFAARSAAASAKRSNMYATNPTFRSYINGAQEVLDDALMSHGMPEIGSLSTKYFRAAAKEAFDHVLPQNKNMSPNVLRAMLMGKMLSDAASEIAHHNPGAAVSAAIKAGIMSPALMGGAISTFAGQVPGTAGLSLSGQVAPVLANAEANREQPK